MPFKYPMRPYTRENIESVNKDLIGVYGIFKDDTAIYIGTGNIRGMLLSHLSGDNACIARSSPNQWTAEVFTDPGPRETHLLREYKPVCNQILKL